MALRFISAARISFLLKPKLKPTQPQSRSYLFRRDRLVPFVDEVPTVLSTKAIRHHWGVIPIIAICTIGLLCKFCVIMRIALTRDDVWYTKNSARCENLETRQGPWYKVKSRKFWGRDDYTVPSGAILASQGCTNGPSFPEDDDVDDDGGVSAKVVVAHIAVFTAAITVVALL